MMFSTHCVHVLSNVNILWIVLDSALAMICAQTSDTWELCDCALFNYIEYFCLKKSMCGQILQVLDVAFLVEQLFEILE